MNVPSPLASFSTFRSGDFDETCRSVAEVFCSHQLQVKGGARKLATQMHEARFADSALVHISYGTAVRVDTDCLGHCFLIQAPWSGSAEVASGSHRGVFPPGVASVISPTQPMRMRWSHDCSFYTVRLNRSRLERQLAQLLGEQLRAPLLFDPVFRLDTAAGKTWRNCVEFVRRQLQVPLPADTAAPLLRQLEDTLCFTLLQLQRHNYTARLQRGNCAAATPGSVKRACDYIRDNIQRQISLDDLAAATGVAAATLRRHFRHYLKQSPQAYIRAEKLDAVHDVLRRAGLNQSVTDIALQYGFNHLGRFADYYRRRHGELPSETLKYCRR